MTVDGILPLRGLAAIEVDAAVAVGNELVGYRGLVHASKLSAISIKKRIK